MSLLRLVFDDEFPRPVNLFDQNFGLGLLGDDLFNAPPVVLRGNYYRPWRHLARQQSGTSSLQSDKDGFRVNLDVQQFKPEEVTVKMSGERSVTVEGKHEEKQDEHGFISRHFVRRYVLPEDIDVEKFECKLSTDGILAIAAPKKVVNPPDSKERVIPITHTGAPAVKNATTAPPATAAPQEKKESEK